MSKFIRGALIEYGSDFLGPIPNVVIFQFNPETLSRTIRIPGRQATGNKREASQAGESPTEQISLTTNFNAADNLNENDPLARTFGIGPRLAALEKMVYPAYGSLMGAAIDKIGDAIFGGDNNKCPTQTIPREKYPRILFIWGVTRVLPVIIESMSITEQSYDFLLNPIQAEVSLSMGVLPPDPCSDDWIANGAYEYSALVKDVQAMANLANTAKDIVDIIPF